MASKKELTSDKRFSRITKDPRFWEMPEKDRKIKIDSRFRAMFHDKKFKLKYTVDKRGRPINRTSTEDLKRFYDLSDSDSDISETDSKQTEKKTNQKKVKSKGGKNSTKPSVGRQTSKQADEVSSVSQSDTLKSDGQKDKSFKPEKDIERKKATEFPQDLASKQNNCDEISKETLCKKSSKKTVIEKAIGKYMNDFTASHVKEAYVKNKSCEIEESSNLEESKSSGESEEEDKLEDNSDLQEESDLGDEGAIREESTSEEDEEDSANESQTESDESDDSGPDLARGKGNLETSSEDEEENDFLEIFPKDPEVIHEWGELGKDAPEADQVTRRLAVCNMDWDRLKAKDLLALLNSFTPKGGVIFSVKIYPSEFGKQRMKEEKLKGPAELLSLPENVTEKDSLYKEKLRDYQFKRLKYFYAVVDCDSPETANKIYEECDGLEFESSYSFVDLRFIPDDVTFDDEPKDTASEVDVAAYKPKYFTSAAVATSKVDITWDETDQERVTSLSKNFKKDELLDMDFQAYLASSSEEEEEDEKEKGNDETIADGSKPKEHSKDDEDQIVKYRELLKSIQEKEKKQQDTDIEMEIKWVPGLKENAEEMVRNKLEGKDNLTPWQQFLEKKKEKRKMKKKQKAAAVKETLSGDECPSDVDLNDPYFAEELGKPGLNKTLKKGKVIEEEEEVDVEKQKAEMALLMMDDVEDEKSHFNYDKIVEQQNLSKRKKKLLMKKEELVTDDFQFQFNAYKNLARGIANEAILKTNGTYFVYIKKIRLFSFHSMLWNWFLIIFKWGKYFGFL
ncbi:ESF1 homolog isoform X2 [Erythrolamprus reginae]|uniref:ESF1 homolog isoform X2 n=1 Tax=Erythrolamprus reginae TaxID=121349 RepID=UPI00396CB3A5